MKKAAGKMLTPVFAFGVCVTFSGILWIFLYLVSPQTNGAVLAGVACACLLLQIAAFVMGKRFTKLPFWPGSLMLLAAPATLWSAFAGPRALYGVTAQLLDLWREGGGPLLSWAAVPVMASGVLSCAAWGIVGLLFFISDCAALAKTLAARRARAAPGFPPKNTLPVSPPPQNSAGQAPGESSVSVSADI